MVSISREASGSWQVRWYEGKKYKSKCFKSRDEAVAFQGTKGREIEEEKSKKRKRKFHERRENNKVRRQKYVEKFGENNLIETRGMCLLDQHIRGLKRVWDGARADLFLSTHGEVEGYGIQVKVATNRKGNSANFSGVNKYEDLIVICVLLSESKAWIFHGKDLCCSHLEIGITSKYSKHEVALDKLEDTLNDMTKAYESHTLDYFNRQLPPAKLNEYLTHKQWKESTGATIQSQGVAHIENSIVDCVEIINGYEMKIQEKVADKSQNGFRATLSKYFGLVNGKSTSQPYEAGDCDIYRIFAKKYGNEWTSERNIDKISKGTLIGWWNFPESILIQNGYITTTHNVGKKSLHCFLPEYVAEKHGFPLPKRIFQNTCSSIWTRDYFVEVPTQVV